MVIFSLVVGFEYVVVFWVRKLLWFCHEKGIKINWKLIICWGSFKIWIRLKYGKGNVTPDVSMSYFHFATSIRERQMYK